MYKWMVFLLLSHKNTDEALTLINSQCWNFAELLSDVILMWHILEFGIFPASKELPY